MEAILQSESVPNERIFKDNISPAATDAGEYERMTLVVLYVDEENLRQEFDRYSVDERDREAARLRAGMRGRHADGGRHQPEAAVK
jgi:hypothetical protein